jgi:hypothetical protein
MENVGQIILKELKDNFMITKDRGLVHGQIKVSSKLIL